MLTEYGEVLDAGIMTPKQLNSGVNVLPEFQDRKLGALHYVRTYLVDDYVYRMK